MTEQKIQEEGLEKSEVSEVVEELDPREVEMEKEQGLLEVPLVKSEEIPEEKPKEKPEEIPEQEEDIEKKINKGEDLTPQEENKVHDWEPDKKAMYWKWKAEKQKRQVEVKKKELLSIKATAKDTVIKELEDKVKKYESGEMDEPDGSDLITREEALKIAKEAQSRPDTGKTIEEKESEYKVSLAEGLAYRQSAKDPNFEKVSSVMAEISQKDPAIATELLSRVNRLGTSEFAEDDLLSFMYRTAERSGIKIEDNSKINEKENVNRIIQNSTKHPSSASLNAGGSHVKTLEEYEASDIIHMSDADFGSLPEKEREYLLRKFG